MSSGAEGGVISEIGSVVAMIIREVQMKAIVGFLEFPIGWLSYGWTC
jgi:hypothetical protein